LILANGAFALFSLQKISHETEKITKREIPLVRSVQEALVAMVNGQDAAQRALQTSDLNQVINHETAFRRSMIRFTMFIEAITWGSESAAFAQSSSGRSLKEWGQEGLKGTLVVSQASLQQAQLAGQANLYFGGFANNAQRSIAAHKQFLRLSEKEEETEQIKQASVTAMVYSDRADRFLALTIATLTEMVQVSNEKTVEAINDIEHVQTTMFGFVLLASLLGFAVALFTSSVFTSSAIATPLASLTKTVQEIAGGDLSKRAEVTSKDEIGQLALSFNKMAKQLQSSYANLEAKVLERTKELKKAKLDSEEKVSTLERFKKLTIGRELKMTQLKAEIQKLNKKTGSLKSRKQAE